MEIAANYVDKNIATLDLTIDGQPKFTFDKAKDEFTVEINGKLPTSVMSLAGVSNIDVKARSVALLPLLPPVEMVFALDTTGSMMGSKLEAMKLATTNMATTVLKSKDAKVGIVPFSNQVNIGVARRNNAFFNVPADYTAPVRSCATVYPDKSGCRKTTTTTTCTGVVDGIVTTRSCTTTTETCSYWGPAVNTCSTNNQNYKFGGCIGSRVEDYRARLDDVTKKYPGFLNSTCAAEMLDLTTKISLVKAKIASLAAGSETYLPAGLTWGWNMLDSENPLNTAITAEAMAAKDGLKVLVLMTDGTNTLAPASRDASHHMTATASYYRSANYSNQLTAQLCENIKKAGIQIFTVQFSVADAALESLLTNCASSKSRSYKANDADELAFAFDKMLADLTQVRIAR